MLGSVHRFGARMHVFLVMVLQRQVFATSVPPPYESYSSIYNIAGRRLLVHRTSTCSMCTRYPDRFSYFNFILIVIRDAAVHFDGGTREPRKLRGWRGRVVTSKACRARCALS